jgi:hypothetical protein
VGLSLLLDKAGRREGELDWRGYHVTWWALPGDARFSLPDDLAPGDMAFGDVIRLDGWAFSPEAQAGEAAWATLHFTLLREADADYRVSLRLRDSAGNMLSPTDKDLLNDRHMRTSAWPLGDARLNQAINVYTLAVRRGLAGQILPGGGLRGKYTDALPVSGALPWARCTWHEEDVIPALLGNIAIESRLRVRPDGNVRLHLESLKDNARLPETRD